MTKVVLLCDTHFGVRNDAPQFIDYFKESIDNFLLPYMKKNKIKRMIHLGDLVHRRKFINFQVLRRMREDFLDPIEQLGIKTDIISGNHDEYFRDTNKTGSLYELVGKRYSNITIHLEPTRVVVGGIPLALIPWVNDSDESEQAALEFMEKTDAQIVFGHFPITGFDMNKGQICLDGIDQSIFKKFDSVYTGHFHHKSTIGNISYLGAFCEHEWTCYDDPRGFHVLDTTTREIEFIQNPIKMFHKIFYHDGEQTQEQILGVDFSQYRQKTVKVIIKQKTNHLLFDSFIERLQEQDVFDLQVVEDHLHLDDQTNESIVQVDGDTIDVFNQYISTMKDDTIKPALISKMSDLYKKATLG